MMAMDMWRERKRTTAPATRSAVAANTPSAMPIAEPALGAAAGVAAAEEEEEGEEGSASVGDVGGSGD